MALTTPCSASAFVVQWGSGADQLGLVNAPEQERTGPLTFTVAPSGNLFVADSVNRSVKEFSPDGTFIRVFASSVRPSSMSFASSGELLMLDGQDVTIWNNSGRRTGGFRVPDSVALVEGYAQDVFEESGSVAVNDPDESVYLFSRDEERPIRAAAVQRGRSVSGSQRAFTRKADRTTALVNPGMEGEGDVEIRPGDIRMLGAVLYRGRSRSSRPLFEVEEIVPGGEVRLFLKEISPGGKSGTGTVTNAFTLPNNYFTTIYRKFEVQPDGNVWQMLTTPDGVRFILHNGDGE